MRIPFLLCTQTHLVNTKATSFCLCSRARSFFESSSRRKKCEKKLLVASFLRKKALVEKEEEKSTLVHMLLNASGLSVGPSRPGYNCLSLLFASWFRLTGSKNGAVASKEGLEEVRRRTRHQKKKSFFP